MKNKKLLGIILVLMVFVIAGCKKKEKPVEHISFTGSTEFQVVHIGSSLGKVEENTRGGIGFPRINGYLKSLKKKNSNLLTLDSGNLFYGSDFAETTKGQSIVEIANKLNLTAMTTGVQDYAYGLDRLKEIEEDLNFPIIAANVVYKRNNKNVFKPYITKDIDGLKVGIIGIANPNIALETNPLNIIDIRFTDPIKAVKDSIDKLHKDGADYIIVLSCLGIDSTDKYSSIRLAKEVDGIDLIFSGYYSSRDLKDNYKVGNTTISNSKYDINSLGLVDVQVKRGLSSAKSNVIQKDSIKKVAQKDKGILDIIKRYKNTYSFDDNVKINSTPVKLNGDRKAIGMRETNFGDLVAESMLKSSGADFAILNSGSIRGSIPKGNITHKSLAESLPFENYNVLLEVTGQTIVDTIENGIQFYPETSTRFPQIAGFKVVFDPQAPPLHRVVSITKSNGEKISLTQTYKLATTGFIASGGGEYSFFKDSKVIGNIDFLQDLFVKYINKYGVRPTITDGRISKHFNKIHLKN